MSLSEFSGPEEVQEWPPEWSEFNERQMIEALRRNSPVLALASLAPEEAQPEKHVTALMITGAETDAEGRPLRFTGYDTEEAENPQEWTLDELRQAVARAGFSEPLLYPGQTQELNSKTALAPQGAISFRGDYGNYGTYTPSYCRGWASDGGYTC